MPAENVYTVLGTMIENSRTYASGGKAITIDEGAITVDAGNGNRIVIGSAGGAITIDAASTVRLRAPQIALEATGTLDIKAGGTLTLRGSMILIN